VEVRREIDDYFTRHTESSGYERPKIDGVHFDSLTEEQNACLIGTFEVREI